MAYTLKYAQLQSTTLAGSGASIGDTSITLTSFQTIDGVNLAMTDFGSIGYATIEPNGGAQEEQISFTGITQNGSGTATLTGIKHVLFITPYTETSGLTKSHAGGVKFVVSNTSKMYQTIIDYIDGIAIAGSPDMTTTTKGIAEEATAAQINAGTQAGETSAELAVNPKYLKDSIYYTQLPTADEKAALAGTGTPNGTTGKYVTYDSTGETGASKVARIKSTGKLDNSIIDFAGNIPSIKSGATSYDLSQISGVQNIAHGLGVVPRLVRISGKTSSSTCISIADTVYTTAQSSNYMMLQSTSNEYSGDTFKLGIGASEHQVGVVTVDATNIIITWTKTGSPVDSAYLIWEAQA